MRFNKYFSAAIASVLSVSMIFGMTGVAYAAETTSKTSEKDSLVYVSIGDSMTNGYGLDGYTGESGIMNYGTNTYANQFAAWLAGYEGEIKDDQVIFKGENGTVDHRQLAMSGLRAEDLAWLLELNCSDDNYAKMLVRFKNDPWSFKWDGRNYRGFEYEWDGGREYWYSKDVENTSEVINGYGFKTGDWRTWTDLLDPDYRLADGAAKILSMYGTNGFTSENVTVTNNMITTAQNNIKNNAYYPNNGLNDSTNLFGAEGRWLSFVSEFYQDSVADADVLTLALGNTNFGTFMFDSIKDIFLNPTAKSWFPSRYHIDEVYLMAEDVLTPEMLAEIEDLIENQVNPILNEQFGDLANEPLPDTVVDGSKTDPYGLLEDYTKGALVKYIVKYCVLSYIVSYVASLERIVELNPDVDLIQVALMNAYKTENGDNQKSDGIDFAGVIDMIYTPVNAFIAMLPSYLADQEPEKYDEATFYYADCGTVETLSAVFGNDFYTYDGKAITYDEYQEMLKNGTLDVTKLSHNDSTVRERFHHWLASTQGCYQNRDHNNGAKKCEYCKGYLTYYYLWLEMGFDRSVGKGTSWGWCDVTSYGEMWKGLLGPLECNFPDYLTTKPSETPEYKDEYQEWLAAYNSGADMGETSLINKFFNEYRLTYVTEADIIEFERMTREAQNALLNGESSYERDKAFSCAMYLAFEDATIRAGKNAFKIDDLTSVSGLGYETFGGAVERFTEKMGVSSPVNEKLKGSIDAYTLTKNLSDALVEDGPSATMLCLANRMQIGTGIGGHPSEGGHDTMAKAIQKTYEEKHESQDEILNILLNYLSVNYPNLMDAIGAFDGIGNVDDLAIIMSVLKASDNAALEGVDLDALETEIRKLNTYVDEELSYEDQEFVLELSGDIMDRVQNLASKATYSKYEVTEDSFYVSLGDSNVNGYGLDGYVDGMQNGLGQVVEASAPVMLAKELYGDDWKNHFGQYAQGALRSEDMLQILGVEGIENDAYYDTEIAPNLLVANNLKATSKKYIDALKKADLISVAVGGGNVTTFVGRQVDLVLAGKETVEMDWAKLGITESETVKELNSMLDTFVPIIDELGLAKAYLPEGMEKVENPAEFARVLAESLLYGYASYNYYYPQVLERIREINPDAQVLILGMFNPVDDWTLTTEIDGVERVVPIGGIVNNIMESANLQSLAYALQNDNTTFIDLSDNITFLDEKIAGGFNPTFTDYYKDILEGNGKQVHASAAGHVYMKNQMYAALQEEYLDDPVKVALETLLPLVEKYYDDAYAYAYKYATNKGYIETVIAELDAIYAELDNIDVDALEATDAFKAELKEAIKDAKETIEQLKVLVAEADELDDATYAEAVELLNKLGTNLEDIVDLLTVVGSDLADAAWDKYIELKPVVIENLKEAVKAGTDWLLEKVGEAYDAFVESVVELAKEYAPEVADYVYDWLYNNPEKVIGFFNEYGDEMVEFVVDNHEAILAVLGFLANEFGDDVVNYVMENPKEVLSALVDLYNEYGEDAWELIKVYLDELGVTEALTNPENIKAALSALNKWLAENGPAIADGIYNYADEMGLIDALVDALNELKAEAEATLKEYVESVRPQIEAAIKQLEDQLNTLKEQLEALEKELAEKLEELENAAEDAKAEIEKAIEAIEKAIETVKNAIAEIEAAIAELQAKLAEVDAFINELIDSIEELNAAIENLIAFTKGEVDATIGEVIAQIQAALDKVGEVLDIVKGLVDEINVAIDEAVAFVEAVIEKIEALQNAVEEANEFLAAKLDEVITGFETAVESLKAFSEETNAALLAKVNAVVDAFKAAYLGATAADYEVTPDSYYVSIGGSYVNGTGLDEDLDETTFGYRVAEALGLNVDSQYAELGRDGLRAEDIRYILDENFEADAYGKALIKNVAKDRAKYVEEIEKADLITVSAGNDNLTTFVSAQVNALLSGQAPYAMDWSRYFGTEGQAHVDAALAEVEAYFVELGMEDIAPMLTTIVESYAYGYVGYAFNHAEAVNAIHAINPDAQVIVLGMYNGIDDLVVNVEGTEVAIGEYVNYFVDLTGVRFTAYAMLTPNTIFVEIPDTTTFFDETVVEGELNEVSYIWAMYFEDSMLPSSTGHEYIKDQILGALNVTVVETGYIKGDVNDDGKVNGKDAMLFERYLADWDVTINLKAADVNEDGKVNGKDAILLERYLAGWTSAL